GYAYGGFNLSYQGEMLDRYGANAPSAFKNNIKIDAPVSMISVKFGYQKYFVPYFGTRFYGDLLLGGGVLKEDASKQPVGSFIYVLGAVNTDLLFDMPLDFKTKKHFLGVYAGFGIGLMLYQDKPNQNGRNLVVGGYSSPNFLWKSLIEVDYTFNVGVSLTLYRKHRLEIGTKLPISYLRMGVEEGAVYQNKEDDERLLISANNQFKRSSFLLVNYAFIF
ncbi:outer membrane beta-barrel protein, partial [Helicobacter pylori]|uniref:outer membrane beta-barrel protein n=1 Tax=Helicobacter pylori TaxID=210 RepID=UPI0035646647